TPKKVKSSLAWGVATRLFVISLARRTDRRIALAPLLEAHGLVEHQDFEFIDATDATDSKVSQIVGHVQAQRRKEFEQAKAWKGRPSQPNSFKEAAENSLSVPWGSDLWIRDPPPNSEYWGGKDLLGELDPDSDYPILIEKGNPFNPHKFDAYLYRQTEATHTLAHEDTNTIHTPNAKGVAYLTRGMVACWHSHVTLIRRIALLETQTHASNVSDSIGGLRVSVMPNEPVYIVLEDDVDFEWDIDERLTSLWTHLPGSWEIAMLGHCWSDESRYLPIAKYPDINHPYSNESTVGVELPLVASP
ncbi:11097_t:CDS:2, partial [Acaulospora colombiana]